jgi:glycyl-tRNA synthetase
MSDVLTFEDAVFRLQRFWHDEGCISWQPINTEVGAGTMNPATFLHVLGPDPWNVAYVEPSVRPDDSRYGDNPNRLQTHTQFQVILKPDTGQPVEQYLRSLAALGIDPAANDIRFVEDNWESPALGAWGLGWEVWLNGLEITQFTYFQQAGGLSLDPVSVEITYGLERILMSLQRRTHFKDIQYSAQYTVGDLFGRAEYELSRYYLEEADVAATRTLFDAHESEAQAMIDLALAIPAYRHLLAMSHAFNVLDARGVVGVTERAGFFARMRRLSRTCSELWLAGLPDPQQPAETPPSPAVPPAPPVDASCEPGPAATLVVEIGTEELPAADVGVAVATVTRGAAAALDAARLDHGPIAVRATPRRLVLTVERVASHQAEVSQTSRGPAWDVAFDAEGRPTKAGAGFARRAGLRPDQLVRVEHDGRAFATATVVSPPRPAEDVLGELLPELLKTIAFRRSMRWDASGASYSRPVRWLVALLGARVVPFDFAGVVAGRATRGLRSSPQPIQLDTADDYDRAIDAAGIVLDHDARSQAIWTRVTELARDVQGAPPESASRALLDEVADLVEAPTPIRGAFDARFLVLPSEVLQTVMVKHQRFFPILRDGEVAPSFVAVANGDVDQDLVREGNEAVIRARYADAEFFFKQDLRRPLDAYRDDLATLTVHDKLGSMLDKAARIEALTVYLSTRVDCDHLDRDTAARAAHLAKNDLVTQMVTEFSGLAGIMGGHYATHGGESDEVAAAIRDHVRPVDASDAAPDRVPGALIGVADRLDSLVGLFAAGVRARSDSDPYGLRRAAHGVIAILVKLDLDLDLDDAVRHAISLLPVELRDPDVAGDVLAFIWRRLEIWMRDAGLSADVVTAAIEGTSPSIVRKHRVARELAVLRHAPEFLDVWTAYTRAARISRGRTDDAPVDPSLFESEYELRVYDALQRVRDQSGLDDSVADFVRSFGALVEPIDDLFRNVFVSGDDPAADNRLALLGQVAGLARGLANLDSLQFQGAATASRPE